MNTEQKAKAYDEAIIKAKALYGQPLVDNTLLETIFPKLAESEDEKIKKELKKVEDEEYNGDDYGIDSLYHAISILEKTLGEVEGYQSDDGILEHKCAITAVKKLYKQKPTEWGEEDVAHIDELTDFFEHCGELHQPQENVVKWLKSLKERMKG